MKIVAPHTGQFSKALLCFVLVAALFFSSTSALYAVPEDNQTLTSGGSITTDIAPEIEIEIELDEHAIDSEEAQRLLALATPEQRLELEVFYAQLDEIDRETEIAVEEYNAAKMRLEQIAGTIQVSQQDIYILEEAFAVQSELLSQRAVDMYQHGGGSELLLYLIFESTSLQDLLARVNVINQINEADIDLMARIRNQRAQLEIRLAQLGIDASEAASLEFEMRARMIEVAARNEDRKQELRDQNTTLILLFEAEQLQRRLAEQQLALNIADGVNSEINIVPGSPVETAMALRGIPYVWGGASRRGFDCSGLIRFVFAQHGVNLPHHSGSQVLHGSPVTGNIQPADLVFFGTPIHHVGMYVGGGHFIHSPRTGEVVSLRALASRSDLVAVRRIDWQPREGAPR